MLDRFNRLVRLMVQPQTRSFIRGHLTSLLCFALTAVLVLRPLGHAVGSNRLVDHRRRLSPFLTCYRVVCLVVASVRRHRWHARHHHHLLLRTHRSSRSLMICPTASHGGLLAGDRWLIRTSRSPTILMCPPSPTAGRSPNKKPVDRQWI